MNELKRIWSENSAWQNICWMGSVVWLFVLLVPALIKEFWSNK